MGAGDGGATAGALDLRLLGELTATRDGEPLDLGGPRQRAVLALLVLARGEVVPAERLADSLWGDAPPANTAGALQAYVSHLRKRLSPGAARSRAGVIVSEGPGYAVRLPPDAVDSWRFAALLQDAGATAEPAEQVRLLREALDLWRGPALADYATEPWAEAETARLTDLRAVAEEQLLAARLATGEHALLVPELEALVAAEPLREERWRLLVLALYRAQRQADALGALRRCRSTLADELGVDPGPALRELENEVLAQSPALDVPRQRSSAPAPAPVAAAPVADDLVDRDAELAALHAALDDLAAGRPRLLLVEGPAGIGKTRLLAEARRLAAARGHRVLTARGSQLEKAFGFGVVRQLFEPVVVDPDACAGALDGAASGARAVFDVVDSTEGSFAVLHGLYWLTVNLTASGPLVLAVDDLQWSDSGSLRFLAYLVRRLEGLPVLVVGTVRTGERHDDEDLLHELSLDAAAEALRPDPLSLAATAAMVRERLGDAAPLFVSACHRTTSGNPLLLRQLLRALEADGVRPDAAHADVVVAVGSRAVSSMVLVRLRRLPPDATATARAVAVLGDGARLPVVARLAELSEDRAAAALAVLARAEIVRDEHPLGFVHALVRDAVYRDLPVAERELMHERAAHLLESSGVDAEQVAAHVLLGPRRGDADAVAVLRRAARTAAERGASDSAVTYLRRAVEEPPDPRVVADVLVELGLVESLVDGPASVQHLVTAYSLVRDPTARAELAIAIARTQVFASPPGTATAFARRAAADLPPELEDARQGLVALQRISGFMQGLDPADYRAEAPPEPSGRGHGAQMLSAALAFETCMDGVDRERTVALARAALAGDRLFEVDNGLFWVVAANTRMLADDDLGDFWQRARREAHARGSLFAALSVNLWAGYWHWWRGDLAEAYSCMRACEEQNRMWGTWVGSAYSRAFEMGVHLDRGDLAAARRLADDSLAMHIPGEGGRLVRQAAAELLVREGRPAEALAALEAVPDPAEIANPVWNPWRRLRASALHALGRTEEAVPLLQDEVAALRRWGAPSYLGRSLRVLGEVLGADGTAHLREAVELLAGTASAVELARAQVALGRAADVPDGEAVPLLHAAVRTAHRCGAAEVRDDARAALAARGAPGPNDVDEAPALSATERRMVELAATGLDARQVAQELFLTPGSVQWVLDMASSTSAR